MSDPAESVDILLDTDVFSYRLRGDSRAALFEDQLANARLGISFQTHAELLFWAARRRWGSTRTADLRRAIARHQIVHSNDEIVSQCAAIRLQRQGGGREMQTADLWIAATAMALGVPLATNNLRDFEEIDRLQLIPIASEADSA